jgi:hypothetical protein
MEAVYVRLADATMILHLLFIVFALFGAFLVIRRRWLIWLHLPAALWAMGIEFAGGICPLTPLENWLRLQGGAAVYTETFVQHYVGALIYPGGLTPAIQLGLGVAVIAINVAIYAWVLAQSRR